MPLTLNDIAPVALCISTADLFDTKRYLANYCDNTLLRARDKDLEQKLLPLKRELNVSATQKKFLEGYKAVIISNLDKILSHLSRYAHFDLKITQSISTEGKELIKKVLLADSFDSVGKLEPTFRSKILLPMHSLFIESMKRSRVDVV